MLHAPQGGWNLVEGEASFPACFGIRLQAVSVGHLLPPEHPRGRRDLAICPLSPSPPGTWSHHAAVPVGRPCTGRVRRIHGDGGGPEATDAFLLRVSLLWGLGRASGRRLPPQILSHPVWIALQPCPRTGSSSPQEGPSLVWPGGKQYPSGS